MRYRLVFACILSAVWLANGQQPEPEPDAGKATGNTFESTFFKFHYSLPQGWSSVNDDARTAENRKRHEDQVKKALAKAAPDTANRKTTTQVFWLYDLLIATPGPLSPGEKPALPHIHVWARERFSMLNEPDDEAKLLASFPDVKVLRKPEERVFWGKSLCGLTLFTMATTSRRCLKPNRGSIWSASSSAAIARKKSTISLKPWSH